MTRLLKSFGLFFSALILSSSIVFAEEITVTTYYPSPYGSYMKLQAVGSDSAGSPIGYFQNTSGAGSAYSFIARGGANNNVPHFQVQDYDGNVQLAVMGTGNVGVGNAAPGAYKLNVSGDFMCTRIYTTASTTAHGLGHNFSDVAESILTEGVESGDVVVIDPSNSVKVIKSNRAYDTTVAGIISETPGFYIGKSDIKDYLPLALAGRVPCKVTTENGPIKRGDLLVTSSKPGYAMKAVKPKIGAILGKALEPLNEGDGKITVLVTLQ